MTAVELAATTVCVTQDHIDNGMPGDACACAFAAAVDDALREQGIKPVTVHVHCLNGEGSRGGWVAEIGLGTYFRPRLAVAELPGTVVDWIYGYDEGEHVAPFEIRLAWVLAS